MGQLGVPNMRSSSSAVAVKSVLFQSYLYNFRLPGSFIVQHAAASAVHSVFVSDAGSVYTCGQSLGQLGFTAARGALVSTPCEV